MKINSQVEYDAVKAKLHNMPLHTNELLLASMEIEKQLLEYRRQNNIYEVGDWVVCVSNDVQSIFKVVDVGIDLFCLKHPKTKRVYNVEKSKFRHATDAEIEANRRLDLPESVILSLGEVS